MCGALYRSGNRIGTRAPFCPGSLTAMQSPWPNFVVHPGAFDDAECDALVRLGDEAALVNGSEDAGIEGLGGVTDLRRTTVAWIPKGEASSWAFERIEGIARSANANWGLAIDAIEEDLQYTLYDVAGSHYTWHHDGLERGLEDRKVSVVVQLSDPDSYRGADLEFLEVATDYDDDDLAQYRSAVRGRGTAVSFCAFEYHRVTPLVAGIRRSVVAWVSGPPLR